MAKKMLLDVQFLREFARTSPEKFAIIAKPKYKIGDRVKLMSPSKMKGLTGTIDHILLLATNPTDLPMYKINLDKQYKLHTGNYTTFVRRDEDAIEPI